MMPMPARTPGERYTLPRVVQLSLTTVASAEPSAAASSLREASFFSLRFFFGFSSGGVSSPDLFSLTASLFLPFFVGASPRGVSSSISRDFFFGGASSSGGGVSTLACFCSFFVFFGGGGGGGSSCFASSGGGASALANFAFFFAPSGVMVGGGAASASCDSSGGGVEPCTLPGLTARASSHAVSPPPMSMLIHFLSADFLTSCTASPRRSVPTTAPVFDGRPYRLASLTLTMSLTSSPS